MHTVQGICNQDLVLYWQTGQPCLLSTRGWPVMWLLTAAVGKRKEKAEQSVKTGLKGKDCHHTVTNNMPHANYRRDPSPSRRHLCHLIFFAPVNRHRRDFVLGGRHQSTTQMAHTSTESLAISSNNFSSHNPLLDCHSMITFILPILEGGEHVCAAVLPGGCWRCQLFWPRDGFAWPENRYGGDGQRGPIGRWPVFSHTRCLVMDDVFIAITGADFRVII